MTAAELEGASPEADEDADVREFDGAGIPGGPGNGELESVGMAGVCNVKEDWAAELMTAGVFDATGAAGIVEFKTMEDSAGTDDWVEPYGKPLYVGAGLHFPSRPAGLPATGTY
jgi:hypothetical protein